VKIFEFCSSSMRNFKMAKQQVWSLSGIARECGVNFRTAAAALRNVEPDGKGPDGKPRWRLATAISALQEHTRRTGYVRSKPAPERYEPKLEAQIAEIDASGGEVDKLLKKLRALPDVAARRALIEAGAGKCVGRHARVLLAPAGDDDVLVTYVELKIMPIIWGEIQALCGYVFVPEAA
jgi:hypothetical protein